MSGEKVFIGYLCPECGRELGYKQRCPECGRIAKAEYETFQPRMSLNQYIRMVSTPLHTEHSSQQRKYDADLQRFEQETRDEAA